MCVVLEHFACSKIASFQEKILKLITDVILRFCLVLGLVTINKNFFSYFKLSFYANCCVF